MAAPSLICRMAVPILERIASQATSWFRMSATVREAVDHRATATGLSRVKSGHRTLEINVDAQFIERPEAWAEVGMPCPGG